MILRGTPAQTHFSTDSKLGAKKMELLVEVELVRD